MPFDGRSFQSSCSSVGMAKVTLRVRHEDGQGVVRGLDPGIFLVTIFSKNFTIRHQVTQWKSFCHILWRCSVFNKLIWTESKCFQVGPFTLFCQDVEYDFLGFPPKPLDISDRDRSIDSLGVRNGDTIIFQNLKPSTSESSSNSNSSSSSSSSCPPAPSLSKAEGPSEAKRKKTEIGAPKMERQVIL